MLTVSTISSDARIGSNRYRLDKRTIVLLWSLIRGARTRKCLDKGMYLVCTCVYVCILEVPISSHGVLYFGDVVSVTRSVPSMTSIGLYIQDLIVCQSFKYKCFVLSQPRPSCCF